jgi:tRNA dimethylallyltransferase
MANSPYHTAERLPIALIAGPTASGKSALAVELAKTYAKGVVINSDASQVYSDLHIISARPAEEEMQDVPHRLFGSIDGSRAYNAASWAEDAKRLLARAWEDEETPVLVGGTGMYLNTLLYGIAPVPDIDPQVRDAVRAMPVGEAYTQLAALDPASAQRLHPADSTRIARALEVVQSTGHSITHWQQQREGGIAEMLDITPLILLPPRDWLRERCDLRLEIMFSSGGIEEVAALRERHLDPNLPVMRAIGVPQIIAYLNGEISKDEALAQAQAATRQYAKRQYTWFRHQPPADWHRHEAPLNSEQRHELAIKLHEKCLT